MRDGQYMLPAEFIAVVAFLFAPAVALALLAQTALFVGRRLFARPRLHRLVAGYAGTVLGSIVIGAALHQFIPQSLGSLFRVRELSFGGQTWPVLPLAFVATAVAAVASSWWALSRRHDEG